NIIILNEKNLPHMWVKVVHHVETQSVVTKAFEDGSVAISVPSVIVKDERNIILNPLHKDFFQKVTIRNIEPIELDDRFRV
ncbi:MAG: RES family NAD+ phosphorylase, partial [Cyclobacteriaceae bacterium]|nr:RES family NAD+ phosphorylase [Cyclobacteriaceae bacterium]